MRALRTAALAIILSGLSFAQTISLPGQSTPVSLTWLYYNKMRWAGAWSGATTYNPQDVVSSGGYTYVSLSASNLNHTPASSPTWWSQLPTAADTLGSLSGQQLQFARIKPNAGNATTYELAAPAFTLASDYNFPAQTCAGSNICSAGGSNGAVLVNGVQAVLTMTPCPLGMGGATAPIRISGGVGTAESVSAVFSSPGTPQSTCTATFTPVNGHSGAWTISDVAGGLQSAVCALPAAGGSVLANASLTLTTNVTACGKTSVVISKQAGATISGAFTMLGTSPADVTTQQSISTSSSTSSPGTWAYHDAGPPWASLTTNWASLSVNVGGYPTNAWFGNGSTLIPAALRGSIVVPSNVTADGAHGVGVEGYCQTNSTSKGCVGAFGYAGSTATSGTYVVGINSLATNTSQPQAITNGHNGTVVSMEADTNIAPLAGGGAPTVTAFGLGLIGASTIKPVGGAGVYAIHADALGYNQSPKIQWDAVIFTEDGTAPIGASLGAVGTGNGVASQSIQMSGRDGGGVTRTAVMFADSAADWVFRPGSAGQLLFEDASGNIGAQLVPNGSAPYFYVPNQLRILAGTYAARPTAVAAGVLYLCTDCAAGCGAGAGTYRLAVSTGAGTTFTCP